VKELTGEQRILRVLDRQEPDRVPHFEWAIDRKVREALAPGCGTLNGFAARMGLDAVLADPDFRKDPAGPGRWRSEWGYVLQDSAEEHGIEVESPIRTMADFERYSPPDPRAPGRYDSIEKTIAQFGGHRAVIVHLNDVFSLPRYLMGYENLLLAIAAEPELVTALVTCQWTSTSPWPGRRPRAGPGLFTRETTLPERPALSCLPPTSARCSTPACAGSCTDTRRWA
jgi:hypothetical protein